MKALNGISAIAQVIIGIALIVLAAGFFALVGEFKTYNKELSRANCAAENTLEYADASSSTTVRTPIEDKYQDCLAQVGY